MIMFSTALAIVALLLLYGHLDLFYAHAEAACDEKFSQSLAECKNKNLLPKEEKLLGFISQHFESRGIGFLLLLSLIISFPRRVLSVFSSSQKEPPVSKDVARAVYFWSMSHIYRCTPIAILCSILLTLHRSILVFKSENIPELVDGHAESTVLYRANDYIQRHHCIESMAA